MNNFCPVCGYGMEDQPANYNICPSCGTEFGVHDVNASILSLRQNWLNTGPRWWSTTDPEPPNWAPLKQLARYLIGVRIGVRDSTPQLQNLAIYLSEPVVFH